MNTISSMNPIPVADLAAEDLREMATNPSAADAEAYRVVLDGQSQSVEVLYLPSSRRAGVVAWGSGAEWTDATSAEDAVRRYLADEMAP